MPEICRFYGIVIRMYYDEHNPPHFHAEYGDDEVWINIFIPTRADQYFPAFFKCKEGCYGLVLSNSKFLSANF